MSVDVSVLNQIETGLKREFQLKNWMEEIDEKMKTLLQHKKAAETELGEIVALFEQYSGIVEFARKFVKLGKTLKGKGDEQVHIHNPKYVSNTQKEELLFKILKDFHLETGEREGMLFQTIKQVLEHRYDIETRGIGDFFRHQLEQYECDGGKRNRRVLFPAQLFESIKDDQ